MQLSTGYEQRGPHIEIVPLIDVVFLLLVFFIYAMISMTAFKGLEVDLPRGDGSTDDRQLIVVTITDHNMVYVDGVATTIEGAVQEVSRLVSDGEKVVVVSGDRTADLGVAVELLSEMRNAGVQAISFRVRSDE